jgi:hypothetical protein
MEAARLMTPDLKDEHHGKEFSIKEPEPILPQWNMTGKMTANSRTHVVDFLCVALNTVSTVLIVFLNK